MWKWCGFVHVISDDKTLSGHRRLDVGVSLSSILTTLTRHKRFLKMFYVMATTIFTFFYTAFWYRAYSAFTFFVFDPSEGRWDTRRSILWLDLLAGVITCNIRLYWNSLAFTISFLLCSTPAGSDFYVVGEHGEQFGQFGALYPTQLKIPEEHQRILLNSSYNLRLWLDKIQ